MFRMLEWQKNGLGMPEMVAEATNEYRQEMDVVARFIADCCDVGTNQSISCQVLFNQYANWCQLEGEPVKSKVALGKEMQLRNFKPGRTSTDRFWLGIGSKLVPGNLIQSMTAAALLNT